MREIQVLVRERMWCNAFQPSAMAGDSQDRQPRPGKRSKLDSKQFEATKCLNRAAAVHFIAVCGFYAIRVVRLSLSKVLGFFEDRSCGLWVAKDRS